MKKVGSAIKTVITLLITVVAVGMMIFTIVSVNTFNRQDRDLFGYKAFIVLSDSMAKTDFDAGDLVVVKEVDPSTLREGDIITYTSQDIDSFGETVTHKIRSRTTDENGDAAFVTYGTTTDVDDQTPVTYPYILGKYAFHLPKLGHFFNFLKTVPGYICCILVPFVILIIIELLNFLRIFKRYRKEQLAEVEAERAQLAEERRAERERSEQMMNELAALRAQLEAQNQGKPIDYKSFLE